MDLRERVQRLTMRTAFGAASAYERLRTGVAFNPTTRAFLADPYPVYRRLRERDPIHRIGWLPGYVLSRYADVSAVLRDVRFSSDERNWSRYERMARRRRKQGLPDPYERSPSMLRIDPPDHTRLRHLVSKAFTPRAVERMRPRVEALVKEHVGRVADRAPGADGLAPMELVRDLAAPLPVIVIAEMLGVPAEDHEQFRQWSDEVVRTVGQATPDDVRRSHVASEALRAYMQQIVDARRAEPREDLISGLVAAEESGDRLSMDELHATLLLLLVAGNETTTKLIANAVIALLANPDQLERLRGNPEVTETAVDELLRYDSPVQMTTRLATEACEIGGRPVRRGEQLILLLGSANRDPEVFPDPDRLDLGRDGERHLSFSLGVHFCLGAQLARLEAGAALRGLVETFPRIVHGEARVDWGDNMILRGPRALHLRVGRGGA